MPIRDISTDSAKTEPTDRSIPPDIITIVRPRTISPNSANWRARFPSVVHSKKCGTNGPRLNTSSASARNGMALSTHFLVRTSPIT